MFVAQSSIYEFNNRTVKLLVPRETVIWKGLNHIRLSLWKKGERQEHRIAIHTIIQLAVLKTVVNFSYLK